MTDCIPGLGRLRTIVGAVSFATLLCSASARAQDIDGLRLNFMNHVDGATADPAWVYALAAALTMIIVWNVASRLRHELAPQVGAPWARNLYLQLRYASAAETGQQQSHAPAPETHIGHVVSLRLDAAVFVAERGCIKGEVLTLDLGSLPGYPEPRHGQVRAFVVGQRMLSGGRDTFLIKVRFQALEREHREPLRRYLLELTHNQRYVHA